MGQILYFLQSWNYYFFPQQEIRLFQPLCFFSFFVVFLCVCALACVDERTALRSQFSSLSMDSLRTDTGHPAHTVGSSH